MKKIFYICVFTGCILACKKDVGTDAPTAGFTAVNAREIKDDTLVFKLGDTCKFNVSGYADNIAYWSGIAGNQYDNRIRSAALGKLLLSFTSQAQYGTQSNTLKVLATTKLAGLDSVSVVNANWTDITARTPLPAGSATLSTGDVDITDLVSSLSDTLYIAFKYSGVTGSTQRTWTITNYTLTNTGADFNNVLSNLVNDVSYWTIYGNVRTGNDSDKNKVWIATTSNLKIIGGDAAAPTNTSWIISRPLFAGRLTPDIPTATVKNLTAAATTSYEYTYSAAGVYKATFAFYNNTKDVTKSGIKQFNIKITP